MGREIKFRSWHLDGSGVHTMHEWSQVRNSFNEYLADSKVMQYTGLKDKNGVDIYEGDLIENERGRTGKVVWGEHFGGYDSEYVSHDGREISSLCPSFGFKPNMWPRHVTVVGNIHQHPELLENPNE